MARQTVVLGAGMVGVSTAWHLRQRGHEVTLVDRLPPGRETSFGNAGIIQREAVRPYPFPATLKRSLAFYLTVGLIFATALGGWSTPYPPCCATG